MKHSFGSDNHSGVHPLIMEALVKANKDFTPAYGEDPYTGKVLKQIEKLLGGHCKALFVFNGTGANVVALSCFLESFHSILAPATAHINVDECGAPEKLSGAKIIPLEHTNGKVSPEQVMKGLTGFGFQHHSQPRILSISQPTELGTVYTPSQIRELADLMHSHGCYLHVDGSRIANAAASLQLPIKSFITDCGVDVLSFGGTKNGLLMGEAVVVFDRQMAKKLPYIRKQTTQLYSKNRFIAAQFEAYLKNDLYLDLAAHSNEMARYMESRLKGIPDITVSKPVESNAVFAILPDWLTVELQKKHYFYVWDEESSEVRWMCSFNTRKEDIDEFIEDLEKLLQKGK